MDRLMADMISCVPKGKDIKRRATINLVATVEEGEDPSLLNQDITQELSCCWHNISFTITYEDEAEQTEPQTEEYSCSFTECKYFKNPDYARCIECKQKQTKSQKKCHRDEEYACHLNPNDKICDNCKLWYEDEV